jgi:acetyl-CoA carboxylase carboxyl transferase subunit beta
MTWFKRKKAGILTKVSQQNESPDGLWSKCPQCGDISNQRELRDHLLVCVKCGYHFRMSSLDYFDIIFDRGQYQLHDEHLASVDRLGFEDRKPYSERLETIQRQTGLSDAVRAAFGKVGRHPLSAAGMDFGFIGGSMGSAVGEVITRAIRKLCGLPVLCLSPGDGWRARPCRPGRAGG